MTYEFKAYKGCNGWEATSEVKIGTTNEGMRILQLSTSKINGGLDASGRVFIRKHEGTHSVETTEILGDFYKRSIAPTPCKRVTQKLV